MPTGKKASIRGIQLNRHQRDYVLAVRAGQRVPDGWTEEQAQECAAIVEDKIARAHVGFDALAEAVGLTGLVFAVALRDGLAAVDDKGRPDNRTRALFARIFADLKAFSGRYRGKQAKETPADVPAKRPRRKPDDKGATELLGDTP